MYYSLKKYYPLLFFTFCIVLSGCSTKEWSASSMQDFFVKFNVLSGVLTRLVTSITYLLGLGFAFRAIYALKAYGEARTMMSSHASIKGPVIYIFIAATFMYLPTAVQVFNNSLFGANTPLGYQSMLVDHSKLYMTGLLAFVRLVGLISFVRGVAMLAHLAQQSGHHQSLGKAVTHIIGGVFAVNIEATIDMLRSPI